MNGIGKSLPVFGNQAAAGKRENQLNSGRAALGGSGDASKYEELAQRTKRGILSINRDGMSYQDNLDADRHWDVKFAGDTYDVVSGWFLKNRQNMPEMDVQKFSVWQSIFKEIGKEH